MIFFAKGPGRWGLGASSVAPGLLVINLVDFGPQCFKIGKRGGAWGLGQVAVKMIAEYLEHALQFERMAADATDPKLKESLVKQAEAYHKLATERAERLNLPRRPLPPKTL